MSVVGEHVHQHLLDGCNIGAFLEYELKFKRFRGTTPIAELPYYPLEYHGEPRSAHEGGSVMYLKMTALCKPEAGQMFKYTGLAFSDQRNVLSRQDADTVSNGYRLFENNSDGQGNACSIARKVYIPRNSRMLHSQSRSRYLCLEGPRMINRR